MDKIKKKAYRLWNENMGKIMEKVPRGQIQVMILSLSFANMDHGSRDQQQLHGFFRPISAKRGPLEEQTGTSKQIKLSKNLSTYHVVQDPDSQTDMMVWSCRQCDQVLKVPVFQDTNEQNSLEKEPEYIDIMERMRKEHEHWHMALDWATESESTH